jgi:hypothetical protein
LTVTDKEIPLDYDSFMEVYQEGNSKAKSAASEETKPKDTKTEEPAKTTTGRTRKRKDDEPPKDEPKNPRLMRKKFREQKLKSRKRILLPKKFRIMNRRLKTLNPQRPKKPLPPAKKTPGRIKT